MQIQPLLKLLQQDLWQQHTLHKNPHLQRRYYLQQRLQVKEWNIKYCVHSQNMRSNYWYSSSGRILHIDKNITKISEFTVFAFSIWIYNWDVIGLIKLLSNKWHHLIVNITCHFLCYFELKFVRFLVAFILFCPW